VVRRIPCKRCVSSSLCQKNSFVQGRFTWQKKCAKHCHLLPLFPFRLVCLSRRSIRLRALPRRVAFIHCMAPSGAIVGWAMPTDASRRAQTGGRSPAYIGSSGPAQSEVQRVRNGPGNLLDRAYARRGAARGPRARWMERGNASFPVAGRSVSKSGRHFRLVRNSGFRHFFPAYRGRRCRFCWRSGCPGSLSSSSRVQWSSRYSTQINVDDAIHGCIRACEPISTGGRSASGD
jgi:hypothetical protein